MSKRALSPTAGPSASPELDPSNGESESKRTKVANDEYTAPMSLHAWLHPAAPVPLMAQSPPLHSSSSTFLSITLSFEPGSHVQSEVSLAKEARRVVRELNVVKLVGEGLLASAEGAFQDGEGRAGGPGTGKGKERAREPDHRMWAVRTLGLKEGKDGTKGEDDYQLLESFHDDGEKFGGERVLRVLRENNAVDVLTVCCRWYGGDMIGPIRFQHIAVTTQTSLKALLRLVQLRDLRTTLEALDEEISNLRLALTDIADLFPPGSSNGETSAKESSQPQPASQASVQKNEKGKYEGIDDAMKLERLVKAKERTRDTLQAKLGTAIS